MHNFVHSLGRGPIQLSKTPKSYPLPSRTSPTPLFDANATHPSSPTLPTSLPIPILSPTIAPVPPLFTVPIKPTGSIVCTNYPAQKIYLLTWSSPPDNRLTPAFIKALILALDIIEYRHPTGVVVTTSAIPKFYSNGLDYESAVKDPKFFPEVLYPLWRRFLT